MAMRLPGGIAGARMTDVDSAGIAGLAKQKTSHGVFVTSVATGSPAARLGLRVLDILVSIDDVDVVSTIQLYHELSARGSNRSIQFVVLRDGKFEKLTYEPR